MEYNYYDAVRQDVIDYIREHLDALKAQELDRDDLEQQLNEDLWIEDSVTGSASGSYTCNAWQAAEYLAHNWDLLLEALQNFGGEENPIEQGEEWCDVTIRCYVLGTAISGALDELTPDLWPDDSEEEVATV